MNIRKNMMAQTSVGFPKFNQITKTALVLAISCLISGPRFTTLERQDIDIHIYYLNVLHICAQLFSPFQQQ